MIRTYRIERHWVYQHLQQVFDRFYKVDAARTRGKQGTGLGLFICKMIIEDMVVLDVQRN